MDREELERAAREFDAFMRTLSEDVHALKLLCFHIAGELKRRGDFDPETEKAIADLLIKLRFPQVEKQ